MRFFNLFSGKNPLEYEQKGDMYLQTGGPGKAKIEYEAALAKLEKISPDASEFKTRLEQKIRQSKEALALEHKQSADTFLEAGYYEDAREYYDLALELTEDADLSTAIDICLQEIENCTLKKEQKEIPDIVRPAEKVIGPANRENGHDYFAALCGTLPDNIRKTYLGYGDTFRKGYIALNKGVFEQAAKQLSLAMTENPSPESFIPLELATAYLNLEKYKEAQLLLEAFVENQPKVLPGYQLLCEILWETKAFDAAEILLSTIPEELKESVAVYLLRGETYFRRQRYAQAKTLYLDFLQSFGWHEHIARALARTLETRGEIEKARQLYGEILNNCRSCGARIDPFIKRKFADLSLEAGLYSTKILEHYLSLVQEDPERAAQYHQKISRIYSALGNEAEARRFQLIANKLENNE
jgi:tetratricopeptide (TPR) repeat protein